jgi:hypothetical protein
MAHEVAHCPKRFDVQVEDGDALVEDVHQQAEDGADLI